jgi:serine/threonine protein kinase
LVSWVVRNKQRSKDNFSVKLSTNHSFACYVCYFSILYQLVYGHSPFAKINNLIQKMRAITNPKHEIDYPSQSGNVIGGLVDDGTIEILKSCLSRNAKQRPVIKQLLEFPFFSPTSNTTTKKQTEENSMEI